MSKLNWKKQAPVWKVVLGVVVAQAVFYWAYTVELRFTRGDALHLRQNNAIMQLFQMSRPTFIGGK